MYYHRQTSHVLEQALVVVLYEGRERITESKSLKEKDTHTHAVVVCIAFITMADDLLQELKKEREREMFIIQSFREREREDEYGVTFLKRRAL